MESSGTASAESLQCGDVVAADTALDQNFVCKETGLTVTDGATLDLAGHSLVGPGNRASGRCGDYRRAGVVVESGNHLVAVIEENVIRRNTFDGVAVSRGADGLLIAGNRVSRNGEFGIFVNSSTTRILRNTANANGRSGIYVFDQYGTFFPYWVEGNVADRNGDYGIAYDHCIRTGRSASTRVTIPAKHDGMAAQCLNIACAFNRGLAQRSEETPTY